MRDWRELGEVPDSDDESFDDTASRDEDQEIDEDDEHLGRDEVENGGTQVRKPDRNTTEDGDVWSLPSSSPEPAASPHPIGLGQASQVLSQVPLYARSATKQDGQPGLLTATTAGPGKPASSPTNRLDAVKDSFFEEDEISAGYVRVTTPTLHASSLSPLSKTPTPPGSPSLPRASLASPQPRTSPPQARLSPLPAEGASSDEADELSRQTAVRLERSLRPRKPIQQHPYLLENAQYTTFMKSHGVKPIRVVPESQPARRTTEEEDSQDQDFQAEESQEASGPGPDRADDNAPIFFDDAEDELALTPSLPKTSPSGQQLRNTSSSQQSDDSQTDATSLSDEDLPPLEKLRPLSAKKRRRMLKRQRSQPLSSASRKRPRFVLDSSPTSSPQRAALIVPPLLDTWDLPSSPADQQRLQESANAAEVTPQLSMQRRRPSPPVSSARRPSPVDNRVEFDAAESPIVIHEDSQSDLSDGALTGSADGSDSDADSDVVRLASRRIRGVLPASWLRLDKQQDKPGARSIRRRSPEPSPERNVRRGVALPRQGLPKPTSTAPLMLFDDSGDSESEPTRRQSRADSPVQTAPVAFATAEDDGASVIEEDVIDWMLPGRKRAGQHDISRRAKKQKRNRTQSMFKGRPNQQPYRQPKITQVLDPVGHGAASTSTWRDPRVERPQRRETSSANRKSRKRAATPPLLSILDVVEDDAPRFVRIAARAAKRTANMGKASPSRKVISLATRSDNVDALSVLRDWKSGKTKPRVPAPPRRLPATQNTRPVMREVSRNVTPRHPRTQPQKLKRQGSLDSFVVVDEATTPQPQQTAPAPTPHARKTLQDHRPTFHPAQLEADEREDRRRQLSSRKRTLDAFYKRCQRALDTPARGRPEEEALHAGLAPQPSVTRERRGDVALPLEEAPAVPTETKRVPRPRLRKGRRPQYLDPQAPQYALANDPLPADVADAVVVDIQEHHPKDKLKGLGPYGTHYTHHFEVFPLDRGVFFHASTLIGSGLLRDALDGGLSGRVHHQRPAVSFSLDGRALRWGPWSDNISSELGILVDWVADQLIVNTEVDDSIARKAVEATDFILQYMLQSMSLQGDLEEKAFVSRCLEVFSSFTSRLESADCTAMVESVRRRLLEAAVRITLAIAVVRSLALGSGSDPLQTMKLDDLLKKSASIVIRRLLDCGTGDLRTLYGDLQRSTFRERGIRSDQVLANSWVATMRILESAAIPRCSFWDVTQSVMLSQEGVGSTADAQVLERLWQDLFTLLPLCEVDDMGVLVSGMRHTAPMEGWALPQQLSKRVFQLYQANPRQPPGFNDYCRALVARCHLLVQQWGWRKCAGIIGTIFDFFGSQNLAHLRNEEVYKSPRFLEELDRNPSLSIEPEDRCFHIFIKLLALAIRRLRELGRLKDIKNLVARTLPNHNRQYLKEDTIHQHDLAALRNHHDLLCTLFWVSPPELRPAVHLIEKLVLPSSAHKEACLINVRAWNQLARFVISNGESSDVFRPLAAWRNNVFNQVLDQYLSAASDIEQQFRALSSKMPFISKEVRDEMVAKNKATALDVLHLSMQLSLEVLRRAPTLEAALYALNTAQLQKVCTTLDYQTPGFDWSILRVALETLEHFMGRIEQVPEEEYSSEFSDNVDSHHLEDAVLLVNEQLAKDFFCMGRTTLAIPLEQSLGQHNEQAVCAEKTVTVAARIASRLVKNRVTQLSPYFSTGKHGLFSDMPKNLSTPERRYLPLFLAVLVKNHIFDFKDLGIDIFGLWMLSIVKPQRLLSYEMYLAEVLQHHHLPFLERVTVTVGISPDYNSNVDFFACAMHHMRKTLRESPSPQAKHRRAEFKKTLQLVMDKLKSDLSLLRHTTTTAHPSSEHENEHEHEHAAYTAFTRQIISLIKSHGADICAVDAFFTQPSAEYSPPAQDPHLQAAGIVGYGIRLGERDVRAAPQLFHYLLTSFRVALLGNGNGNGNGKGKGGGNGEALEQECRILVGAMRAEGNVLGFVLRYMLPAVVRASASVRGRGCWVLLEVYVVAAAEVLDRGCVPRELGGEEVVHAVGLLKCVLAWFESLHRSGEGAGAVPAVVLSLQQLHVMSLLASVANTLLPSLTSYLANNSNSDSNDDDGPAVPIPVSDLEGTVDRLTSLFADLLVHFVGILGEEELDSLAETGVPLPPLLLLGGPSSTTQGGSSNNSRDPWGSDDARVKDFANTIITDVGQHRLVSGAPGRGVGSAGTGGSEGGGFAGGNIPSVTGQVAASSLQGTGYGPWQVRSLLDRVCGELARWEVRTGSGMDRRSRRGRGIVGSEELLF